MIIGTETFYPLTRTANALVTVDNSVQPLFLWCLNEASELSTTQLPGLQGSPHPKHWAVI